MPTRDFPAIDSSSPIETFADCADRSSITTSVELLGGVPVMSRYPVPVAPVGQFAPIGCSESPGATTGVPSGRRITAMSSIRGVALATPSMGRTESTIESGTSRRTCSTVDS